MVINLKILFLSDIHGICNNLEYIDKVIQTEKINKLVVLGDLYYCGPMYNDKYLVNIVSLSPSAQKLRTLI